MLSNVEETLICNDLDIFHMDLAQVFALLEKHVHGVVVPDAGVGEVYVLQMMLMEGKSFQTARSKPGTIVQFQNSQVL
jgi:hypothetical protein